MTVCTHGIVWKHSAAAVLRKPSLTAKVVKSAAGLHEAVSDDGDKQVKGRKRFYRRRYPGLAAAGDGGGGQRGGADGSAVKCWSTSGKWAKRSAEFASFGPMTVSGASL